jgi:hypothetical protein
MTIPTDTPADRRTIDYDAIVHDLAYAYQGIFSQESVAAAVETARQTLEPTAKVREFLPVPSPDSHGNSLRPLPKQKDGSPKQCPKSSSSASTMLDAPRLPPRSRSSYRLAESTYDPRAPNRPTRSIH